MNWIEGLGIFAGCLIYGAMLVKKLVPIKAFLLGGAICFLSYGILLGLPAIIIVNVVGTIIGIVGLVRVVKGEQNNG